MQSNEWIEIVFESIALKKIPALLKGLTENGALIFNYSTNHENDEIRWYEEGAILEFFNAHSSFCLFVNLSELRCEEFKIPKLGLI